MQKIYEKKILFDSEEVTIEEVEWYNNKKVIHATFSLKNWSKVILTKLKEYGVQDVNIYGFAKNKVKYETLSCLKDLVFLKKLVLQISNDTFDNLDQLYDFQKLESLKISQNVKNKINIARLAKLEELQTKWRGVVVNIEKCQMLKKATIEGYSEHDLEPLSKLKKLKSLEIMRGSKLVNLDGCDGLINLEFLSLYRCNKLEDISMLENVKQLRKLHIESCEKISSFNKIGGFKNLEELLILDCGEIESFRFIEKLPKLKRLIIGGTTKAIDNGIAFIFQLPAIEGVSVGCYPGYDMTFEEYCSEPLIKSSNNPIKVNWDYEINVI